MNPFILCVILLNIINAGIAGDAAAEGYYWRDFNGAIPTDALPGGVDENGQPIYIGQMLYRNHLVPAKIYSDGRMSFEFDRLELNTALNMKILCTPNSNWFEWIPTTNIDIKLLTERNLINGGYDNPGTATYIGRVQAGGEVAVGKVILGVEEPHTGLHITINGHTERHTSFGVLAFNPPSGVTIIGGSKEQGYYWRDFNGAIPTDALPGGVDAKGQPIYIGQMLYNNHLVPGKIYSDSRISFEFNRLELNNSLNMKILCTQRPNWFEWIPTTNVDVKLLTDRNLINGGYDWTGTTTYIGRVHAGGEVAVGKVILGVEDPYTGLHITKNGHGERHTSFAVLAFNLRLAVPIVGGSKEQDCKQVTINFFSLT